MKSGNIYKNIPNDLSEEAFQCLAQNQQVKIERIVSMGHTSPASGWYDQEQDEWVLVLRGSATLSFADEAEVNLEEGDYINIPAHKKHRVTGTSAATETIWLAVFY